MSYGDDLRKELFNKVGTDEVTNPLEQLKIAENEISAGNHAKGKQIIQSIIDTSSANAKRYEDQKQHRSAAESYYIQGLAYEKMEDTSERDQNYSKVADELLIASKNAFNFGENNRAVTSVTIAGLVCLMFGNEDRAFEIYNEAVEISQKKEDSETLKRLLFALGYLLDALRNTNMGALTDAQNFISTDLKPMLTTSKLLGFTTLLDTVVSHTREIIESRIKMPKIQIGTQIPRDMLYNSTYEIIISIANNSEGEATDVQLEMQFPEDIEILNGDVSDKIGDILPNINVERNFSIRSLSGESTESIREVTGHVMYTDMLQNTHKQSLGKLSFEFRAVSRTSEYEEKLKHANEAFLAIEEKIAPNIPSSLTTAIRNLAGILENEISSSIKSEDFEISEFSLNLMENISTWANNVIVDGDIATAIINDISTKIEDEKNKLNEELTRKFDDEKETAISSLRLELEGIKEQELSLQKSKLLAEKDQAVSIIKESLDNRITEVRQKLTLEFDKELKELQQVSENKLRQQLTQQESKLREELNIELQEKNDEIESAIRDIQSQQVEEVAKEKEVVRAEITKKFEEKIEQLESEADAEVRRLKDHAKDVKESELNTLRSKLIQEQEDALQSKVREFESKHQQEIAEKIDNLTSSHNYAIKEKDEKIQQLESRLRDFSSSVEPIE